MKFLKKILCLTAVLSLLSGCQTTANHDNVVVIGGTYTAYEPPQSAIHNENKSTGIAGDNSLSDDNAPSATGFDWELRDLVLYSIDNSMYTDTTAPDGSNLRLTVPSVTYSYKEVFKFLNENAFMKKNPPKTIDSTTVIHTFFLLFPFTPTNKTYLFTYSINLIIYFNI